MSRKLEIIFDLNAIQSGKAWQVISETLKPHGCLPDILELYGEKKSSTDLISLIGSDQGAFNISSERYGFHFATVWNHAHCFLEIKAKTDDPPINWEIWVAGFSEQYQIVQSWISDIEYSYWQNAEDVLQYQAKGKPYAHFKMKSNGLPPPLEQQIIDISGNPGRRILRNGYVEAVGSTMWLGKRFWELTKADRKSLDRTGWNVTELDNHITRIQVSSHCFDSDESKELQNEMRKTLFPESAFS